MLAWIRSFFYRRWVRALTILGDLQLAFAPPRIRAKDIRKLLRVLRPGDIVCRKYTWYLDAYLIPGKFTHSGVYVNTMGLARETRFVPPIDGIVHAVAEGVVVDDVIDYVKDADGFCVLRPRSLQDVSITGSKPLNVSAWASSYAMEYIGLPYDFLFDSESNDAMYCHELSAKVLRAGGADIEKTGRVFLFEDLARACEIVMEVNP